MEQVRPIISFFQQILKLVFPDCFACHDAKRDKRSSLHLHHAADENLVASQDTEHVNPAFKAIDLAGTVFHFQAPNQLSFNGIDLDLRHVGALDGHLVGGRVGEDAHRSTAFFKTCVITGTGRFGRTGNAFLEDGCHGIAMHCVEGHFCVVVSGFGEAWLIGAFASSYQWSLFGKQGIIDTIDGKIPYTDSRWLEIFKLFEEMRNNKMFASGIVTMVNKDAERTFATGRAAMTFNGSWGINVYKSMNSNLNYGIMYPPSLPDAKYPLLVFGGDGSSMFVNGESPRKDKAIAFLKWFTQREQQSYLAEATLNIPSNKESAQDLPEVLQEFSKSITRTFENLPKLEAWQVTNYINLNLQSVIIGEKDPEKAVNEVQAEKIRQMKVEK